MPKDWTVMIYHACKQLKPTAVQQLFSNINNFEFENSLSS